MPDTIVAVIALWLALPIASAPPAGSSGAFVHPGLNQNRADLEYLKEKVRRGEQPWKEAFERLRAEAKTDLAVEPVAHISQGGYGANDSGGRHLTATSRAAYDCALLWYVTGDRSYANAAIRILNAWSRALSDFDDNNAKLIASGSANHLCQAAEILRYSSSGWLREDVRRFEEMLLTVVYPLLRFYFPEANGNWDAYIARAIMAIAIFTDNRPMFENAVDHFLYGPVNGSLFKYIHPNGQCQESTRDQGHVRMGLNAYANIAQIAFTQGVDLYSIADNRIALGYEYTAGFLLGAKVHSYGPISEVKREIGDDYESVLQRYTALGIDLPNTRRAAELRRPNAVRDLLTAARAPGFERKAPSRGLTAHPAVKPTGALDGPQQAPPAGAVRVAPGQSIQEAVDAAAGRGGWVVAAAGKHKLPRTLRLPSGVHLAGEGLSTVLWLDPESDSRDAVVAASPGLHDVSVSDLVVEGATREFDAFDNQAHRSFRNRSGRGGIRLHSDGKSELRSIELRNLTVRNCTNNGVWISGARGLEIADCNLDENGSTVVPGPRLLHNLLLSNCSDVRVSGCRLTGSPAGSGISLQKCAGVKVSNCEIGRNGWYGALVSESARITLAGSLIEGNDRSGILLEFLHKGSAGIELTGNTIWYNYGSGIESYAAERLVLGGNICTGNRGQPQVKAAAGRQILMK